MEINWWLLVGLIILINLLGSIGAIFTSTGQGTWFEKLKKPSFNPPNWLFGPAWALLFTLMGIALYFVITSQNSQVKTLALTFFIIQMILNILWSFLFFKSQNPLGAFIEIIILIIMIITTIFFFYKTNKISGYLLIPYLLWTSFASILNYNLWKLN